MLSPQGAQHSLTAHCPRKTAIMVISQSFKAEHKEKQRKEKKNTIVKRMARETELS